MTNEYELADDNRARPDLREVRPARPAAARHGAAAAPDAARRRRGRLLPRRVQARRAPRVPAEGGAVSDRLLDPRADHGAGRARHPVRPQGRARRAAAGRRDDQPGGALRRARGAVPLRGADHRLHRRDPDAVPVRADAGRRRRLRLGGRDDPRPAGARRSSAACCSASCWSSALEPDHASAPRSASRRPTSGGNVQAPRQHPVLPLRLRLRGHQRAADHRGGRRDGAAHRERLTPKPSQADLAAPAGARLRREGRHLGPLPPPGVFARHNAVDTPALLPDGTAAEASVSRVLAARGTVRSAPALADDIEEVSASSAATRPRARDRRQARRHREREEDADDDRVHRPLRDPVHDRLRRRAHPPQRDRGVHVRRADAQRLQPRPGRLRQASTATSTARSPPSS